MSSKADQAAAAAAKRSKKANKGKGTFGYYLAVGTAIVVTVLSIYLAATTGSGPKRGAVASPLDTLVNDAGLIRDVGGKQENYTTAASPFFDKWTLADLKYGFDGVGVSNMVGMAGAVQACEVDDTFEGGTIPVNFDGRSKWAECFGEVVDSGNCTSSYAIAAAQSLSMRYCVADEEKYGKTRLSPQQVLNCDKKSRSCQGGGIDSVWSYIERRGLYPEECLPYTGKKGECKTTCDESKKLKTISHCVMSGTKNIKRDILANGPAVVPVFLQNDFLIYSGGVYSPGDDSSPVVGKNGRAIVHAMTLVGWGKTQGSKGAPYWIVGNSWGKTWGEEGYAKIAMGENVMEHYVLSATPSTEANIEKAAADKVLAEQKKEEAKKERAARDARIEAAKAARDSAAADTELDDLDEPDADLDIDLDLDEKEDDVEM